MSRVARRSIPLVFIDTNAFYPVRLADLVLSSVGEGLFDLCVSDHLLDEIERVLVHDKGLTDEKARTFREAVRESATVHLTIGQYEQVRHQIHGPDEDDLWHLAAAISTKAAWLIVRAQYVWDVSGLPNRRFEPVGMFAGLDTPPSRPIVMGVWAVAFIASVLAASGRSLRFATSFASIAMLFIATFTSSFSQVFHTEHLLVLHLLILAAATLVDGHSGTAERSGWSLNLMMSTVVVAYVVAGIAKLRFGGRGWLTGEVLRNWVAADNLRKVLLDDPASTFGGWLAGVAWIWAPIGMLTLIVELSAPIALVSGRVRLAWLTAAWLFHVGIVVLMAITFPYQLSGVAYAAFLHPERIETRLRRAVSIRRPELDAVDDLPVQREGT